MATALFPTTAVDFGQVSATGDEREQLCREVEAIADHLGIVKATSSTYLPAISTAMAVATGGAPGTGCKLYVSAGTWRVINSVTATSGTAAVWVMTDGATHGQDFYLSRSKTTGACAITVHNNSTAAVLKSYPASKKFGCHLKLVGAAWVMVSDFAEA
jgi:hypothetical protein